MLKRRNRGRRFLGTMLLTLLFAVSAYAFTATNDVPPSQAGDGHGTISGYTVSNVAYTLASDPTMIEKVAFTLDAAATSVKASVTGAAPFESCAIAGGTAVTCTFVTQPTVEAANDLRVVATS